MRCFSVLGLAACYACATASGPWDGTWFYDRGKSHPTEGIELSLAANGTWQFFDGGEVQTFVADGQNHRMGSSAVEVRASQPNKQTLLVTEGIHGREYESYAFYLSPNRQTLTCTSQRLRWDGQIEKHSIVYTRSGPGDTLQGSWKATHSADTQNQSTTQQSAAPSPQPAWVVWAGSDGVMTWFIPRTGETLRGKPDGIPRQIEGPYHDGTSFSWKQTAPGRLEFVAYNNDKPEEYAVETISPDRQTLTDVLWARGHEDSKIVSVFHRRP